MNNQNCSNDSLGLPDKIFTDNDGKAVDLNQTSRHILFEGNSRVIVASREAIGAMKYKSE